MAPVTSSNIIRMNNTPTPVLLVVLATLLLSCNILWLYTAPPHPQKNVCGYLVDSWTGAREGPVTAHSGGGGSYNTSTVGMAAPPPPAVHDYQLVRGSGLRDVPFPIPIPNDTVLLGEDLGAEDGFRPRYLTIGIASVWRKEQYLYRTLDSLLKETTDQDKDDIFIFLLLADADPQFRLHRARELETRYSSAIAQGVLRVLQPTSLLYPTINFSAIWRTYDDSVSRVQWRTKQVLDFAFLFWYTWTRKPSKYYMILEDDVLSARHFVTAARDFVNLHAKRHWIALQLSGFMGIGQLIRCEDMDRLVSFLLLFYREHPVDVLFNHWVSLLAPEKPPKDSPYRRVPGLFQHVGIHSTLANKTQPLRDNTFSLVKRRFAHVNPQADVVTTIRQYKSFVAGAAYSAAPGMFWGIPKAGDTYDVVFASPIVVTRIVIITGASVTKKRVRDRLQFGQLQVSPRFQEMLSPNRALCSDFVPVMEFRDGEVDVKELDTRFKKGIQCLRIVIGSKQRTWVSLSEIAVFAKEGDKNSKATGGAVNVVGGGPSAKAAGSSTGGYVDPKSFGPVVDPTTATGGLHHNLAAKRTTVETKVLSVESIKTVASLTAGARQNSTIVDTDGKIIEGKQKAFSDGNNNNATEKNKNSEGGSQSITYNGTVSVPKDLITLSGYSDESKKETGDDTDKIGIAMTDVNDPISAVSPYYAPQPRAQMLGLLESANNGSVVPMSEAQDVFALDVKLTPNSNGRKKKKKFEIPSHLVSKALSKISSTKQKHVSQPLFPDSVTETQMPNTTVVRKHNFSRVNNHLDEPRFPIGRL